MRGISLEKYTELKKALNFLHLDELQKICWRMSVSRQGTKSLLIQRILHYVICGMALPNPYIRPESKAEKGRIYPLHKNTLILEGAYKNDERTKAFFKKMIGDHFKFTAFGIEWIHNRWIDGNPPTYQEFMDMWQEEYKKRQKFGSPLKAEWAYINFSKDFAANNAEVTQAIIVEAWKIEREEQKDRVEKILGDLFEWSLENTR